MAIERREDYDEMMALKKTDGACDTIG